VPFGGWVTVNLGFDPANAGRLLNGRLADIAFWNVQLTALEVAALARGMRPSRVRPLGLKQFLPIDGLVNPEPDLAGGAFNSTMSGTPPPRALGPPVAPLTPRWPQAPMSGVAPPTFNPAWALGKNVLVEGVAT